MKFKSMLFDLMDNGFMTAEEIVSMCMKYMSDADVEDMMDINYLLEDDE